MGVAEALEIASQTNAGMVRTHNEDSVGCEPARGLVVLADGMGGYNAGEVASGIAVSVVTSEIDKAMQTTSPVDHDEFSGEEHAVVMLRDSIQKANLSIFHAAHNKQQYSGMGTTIVSALFYDNRVAVAHVGDSRMYRLRAGTLATITRDHSLLQEQIDGGIISVEDARLSKNKNLVTRAVGIDPKVETEIHVHDVAVGDVYLLCSDGLNDMVEDEDIYAVMHAMQGNLPLAAEQLIQMANDNGGKDNISVVLVRAKARFPAPRSWLAKLLGHFKK